MKIVIQNGNNVGKQDLQRFIDDIPATWRKYFNTIVVYGSLADSLKITHHQKEGVLGIHCPSSYKGSSSETLEEVAIHLAALNDIGHIPNKLSLSKRDYYAAQWCAKTHLNRVAEDFPPSAPTPPSMRVRTGRFVNHSEV